MRFPMLLLAAILAFPAGNAIAQEEQPGAKPVGESQASPPPPPNSEAEIITVKTLTGDSFNRLMSLLRVFRADIRGDSQLRTIVVYAPKDVVAQVRRVVEQLDRPGSEAAVGKNIEMTLTLLRASPKAPESHSSLPADMESVARQLRNATQYKDIQLWDVVPLRLQEGSDTRETLRLPGVILAGQSGTATIVIHPESVYRKDQGRYVRFSRVNLDFRIPTPVQAFQPGAAPAAVQYTFTNMELHTSGDFMEGQKTVLGKVSGAGEEEAIFAVITMKVLD
jgi:hypothetical protein